MLQRIHAGTPAWPLHGLARTREIEAAALQSVPPFTLMQRAGAAAARLARALAPHTRRAWVAVGPGNNGGDGMVAAVAPVAGEQPGLQRQQRQRVRGRHARITVRLAGVRIEARRHVDREHRAGEGVQALDQRRKRAFGRTARADAEQGVDGEVAGAAETDRRLLDPLQVFGQRQRMGLLRVATQP